MVFAAKTSIIPDHMISRLCDWLRFDGATTIRQGLLRFPCEVV